MSLVPSIETRPDSIGKFYGIGVGPGDSDCLTIQAINTLKKIDVLFCPHAKIKDESLALEIVKIFLSRKIKIKELVFPMVKSKNILEKHWKKAAKLIAVTVLKGLNAGFITIGDPLIYSTYIYVLKILKRDFPYVEIKTIPGISSFQLAASIFNIPLAHGKEKIAILPATDINSVKDSLKKFDTVILFKVGSKLDKIIKLLEEFDLIKNSFFASRVGCKNQIIETDLKKLNGNEKIGYMSIIIVKK